MKKLFVTDITSATPYADELKRGYEAVQTRCENVDAISLDQLIVSYLLAHEIDVVISNGLPEQWYYVLRGLQIVSITLDDIERYAMLADIVIDCRSTASNKYFSGSEYSLISNKFFVPEFCEIIDLIKKMEWDSTFWGVNVSFLSCRYLTETVAWRIEQYSQANHFALIEYLCNCHDSRSVAVAEKNNFTFTDIRLTYDVRLQTPAPETLSQIETRGLTFGPACGADIPRLQEIASHLYLNSRYYFDSRFDREKANLFYKTWVAKGVLGQYDDVCFCLRQGEDPIAFCTVKYDQEQTAQINLLGIAASHQGKGLGEAILRQVFSTLWQRGYTQAFVITQGRNYAAQRLYQKLGFRTKKVELWYHKWI